MDKFYSDKTGKKAILYLENGAVFWGYSFGSDVEKTGEVVFNTGMTGYQEILTDPSYLGQIVLLTYTQIGNYGINFDDYESEQIYAEGLIVKENFDFYSNFRGKTSLSHFLKKYEKPGICGFDTRKLTKLLRDEGSKIGVISTENFDLDYLQKKVSEFGSMQKKNMVQHIKREDYQPITADWPKKKVAVLDFGCKLNILREFKKRNIETKLFSYNADTESILKYHPDGIFLSNGPGDPAPVGRAIELAKYFLGKLPIFGICLGHQILGLAAGLRTIKLKFGHHGSNHPVMRLSNRTVEITAQNHNFAIDPESINKEDIEVTHLNLNDQTVEGMRFKKIPAFSIQYHPEAAPGPNDSKYLFDEFTQLINNPL